MICNTIGLTTDSFETLYVHGGAEVSEIYGGINYVQPIFYSLKMLTGATSYSFMGYQEPLKSYEISGNMVQTGTPTPTSPIYPQECGDRTDNLLEITNNMKSSTEWKLSPATFYRNYFEVYDITNVIPRGIISAKIFENFEPGYVPGSLVCAITPHNSALVDNEYRILTNNGVTNPKTFDTTSWDNVYLCIGYGNGFDSESTKQQKIDELFNNWRIMITASPTPPIHYEPYGYQLPINLNGTTQNLYLTEPLRKIGNYADSINSDGTVTRRIKKLVFDGTENWQQAYNAPYMFFYLNISDVGVGGQIMSHFILGNIGLTTTGIGFTIISATTLRIRPDLSTISSVASFKQWLSSQYTAGTPVTLWHVLYAETTEQVTAPTLTPATGSNTLSIGTTLAPSSVSITGHVKPT